MAGAGAGTGSALVAPGSQWWVHSRWYVWPSCTTRAAAVKGPSAEVGAPYPPVRARGCALPPGAEQAQLHRRMTRAGILGRREQGQWPVLREVPEPLKGL